MTRPTRAVRSQALVVRRCDWADDRGQVAGIEAIPFGILVFVIGTLIVANAWGVIDAKFAVTSAARAGVRAYAEAPNGAVAAERARGAANEAIRGHRRDPERLGFAVDTDGPFARCTRVVATASYRLPIIRVPWLGSIGRGFTVRASRSEVVDPYRDGLNGTASCA
jgi:hypothetical protein